jgi:hypothetical protein
MTARVLPTEPGWWWLCIRGGKPFLAEVSRFEDRLMVLVGASFYRTADPVVFWLEPVAPLGTVARLEAERDEARRIAEARRTRIEVLEAQLLESADGWNWGAR